MTIPRTLAAPFCLALMLMFFLSGCAPTSTLTNADTFTDTQVALRQPVGVIKMDSDGNLLATWGAPGHEQDQLYYPTRITVGPNGLIWGADAYNHRAVAYSTDGRIIRTLGSLNTPGDLPGQFNVAGGVAIDAQGRVWVADFFNNRLQRFTDLPGGQTSITLRQVRHTRRLGLLRRRRSQRQVHHRRQHTGLRLPGLPTYHPARHPRSRSATADHPRHVQHAAGDRLHRRTEPAVTVLTASPS